MSWLETLRTGLGAVLSHRLRSGLTMVRLRIRPYGSAISHSCSGMKPNTAR